LTALEAARETPQATGEGVGPLHSALAPFAAAAAGVSAAIAMDADRAVEPVAGATPHGAIAATLAATRALARDGDREAVKALLAAWPSRPAGSRADRIFAALAGERLRALLAHDGHRNPAPSQWHALWAAWRAGRSIPRA
jgi:hypothetical protein